MAELIIFCFFGVGFVATIFAAAVAYKIKTKSKKSVWYIMNNEI